MDPDPGDSNSGSLGYDSGSGSTKNGIVTPLRGSESVSQLRQWREKGVTDLAQEFDRSIVARGSERHFSLSLSICFHNYQAGVLQFFLVYCTG